MIANVRRRSVSRARTEAGDFEARGVESGRFVLVICEKFTISRGRILDAMKAAPRVHFSRKRRMVRMGL
jgi:hypothetical protein